ncbi:protein RTE1 [Sesamum angolense]|uniref:Protein RTE1 n=1 Tax=Sesamum angolense TaxID=2727404 RepID=A0AAE1X043_9LAMI|nr:protein RTE1 [Sesamum angolense]
MGWAGPNFVCVDNFTFVLDFLDSSAHDSEDELMQNSERREIRTWDDALRKSTQEYQHESYNILTCNCHSFVANSLNKLKFQGGNWNVVNLALLIFIKGQTGCLFPVRWFIFGCIHLSKWKADYLFLKFLGSITVRRLKCNSYSSKLCGQYPTTRLFFMFLIPMQIHWDDIFSKTDRKGKILNLFVLAFEAGLPEGLSGIALQFEHFKIRFGILLRTALIPYLNGQIREMSRRRWHPWMLTDNQVLKIPWLGYGSSEFYYFHWEPEEADCKYVQYSQQPIVQTYWYWMPMVWGPVQRSELTFEMDAIELLILLCQIQHYYECIADDGFSYFPSLHLWNYL